MLHHHCRCCAAAAVCRRCSSASWCHSPLTNYSLPTAQCYLQVLSLRSTNDAVRAAAIEASADLTARERTLALAAEAPAALGALIDAWEGVADALTGRLVCNLYRLRN